MVEIKGNKTTSAAAAVGAAHICSLLRSSAVNQRGPTGWRSPIGQTAQRGLLVSRWGSWPRWPLLGYVPTNLLMLSA